MLEKIAAYWAWIQKMLDVDGDVVMLFFTVAIIFRVTYAAFPKHVPLNAYESAVYATAVGTFGYSKVKKNVAD